MARLRSRLLRRLARLRGEEGLSIIELMAGLTILAVGIMSLAAAAGLGFRLIAHSTQRQTATEVANARIEHLRNLSFGSVGLSTQPERVDDPDHPNFFVSMSGEEYDVTGNGDWEPLIVDADDGKVLHLEDPVPVGPTVMEVFQYATWVDDPDISGTQNYRRLTVVVRFKSPTIEGATRFVRVSSAFTPGVVAVTGAGVGPTEGSPSPSPSPTATPEVPVCDGDTSPPSGTFSIESTTGSSTGYTASTTVTIRMDYTDPCSPITVRFSNDNSIYGDPVTYDPDNPTASWTLTAGDGIKQVWARVADGIGNQATQGPKDITLDTIPPTVPNPLTRTVSCSGNDRTVNLQWGAATDAHLAGYRVYRSINDEPWAAIGTTASTAPTQTQLPNTHAKTLDSVRYRVKAYDRAGNESQPTNEVSLAKNECS